MQNQMMGNRDRKKKLYCVNFRLYCYNTGNAEAHHLIANVLKGPQFGLHLRVAYYWVLQPT